MGNRPFSRLLAGTQPRSGMEYRSIMPQRFFCRPKSYLGLLEGTKFMNQRIRFPFPSAFLSIAGAFGTAAAFLSYGPLYADFSLWVLFLIFTFFLSCILERLSPQPAA